MHLHTIIAFVAVFWRGDWSSDWTLFNRNNVLGTSLWVIAQPIVFGLWSAWASARTRRLMHDHEDHWGIAQQFNHRVTFLLRLFLLAGFVVTALLTPWPDWFRFAEIHPLLQIAGDLIVLSPYFVGAVVMWIGAYPLERAVRAQAADWLNHASPDSAGRWALGHYLEFNVRHHLLVVAVPMTVILFTANLTRSYENAILKVFDWAWAPDALLGLVAAIVFVVAPAALRRIWRTRPLEPGPLRERLEALCRRLPLRCRDILVWETDGFLMNAAVMGIVGRIRYVLLSDALLAATSQRQIEAVFGHEAGHVRHRHIQKFLAFAFVGWVIVAGLMELLARWSLTGNGPIVLSFEAIQGVGVAATVAFWGIGFGMVSRRFERQADLFGARCVTPDARRCTGPCSVHFGEPQRSCPDDDARPADANADEAGDATTKGNDTDAREWMDGRVCRTGAALFASALERVASLNAIPREERSWRHSSIASRVEFLAELANDPDLARRFERGLRRFTWILTGLALLGAVGCVLYGIAVPEPAILSLSGGGL